MVAALRAELLSKLQKHKTLHFCHFLTLKHRRLLKSFLMDDKDLLTLHLSIPLLLMTWWQKEPGHQQPWHWTKIFQNILTSTCSTPAGLTHCGLVIPQLDTWSSTVQVMIYHLHTCIWLQAIYLNSDKTLVSIKLINKSSSQFIGPLQWDTKSPQQNNKSPQRDSKLQQHTFSRYGDLSRRGHLQSRHGNLLSSWGIIVITQRWLAVI